jgi:hypothetical protein
MDNSSQLRWCSNNSQQSSCSFECGGGRETLQRRMTPAY